MNTNKTVLCEFQFFVNDTSDQLKNSKKYDILDMWKQFDKQEFDEGISYMDGKTTIKYLQTYIKEKDYHPELLKDYFLKLSEEVGELSRAMRKGLKAQNSTDILGTVDEELWDVIYYALAIANIYDIDIEQVAKVKSEMNESRYPSKVKFEEGR